MSESESEAGLGSEQDDEMVGRLWFRKSAKVLQVGSRDQGEPWQFWRL